MNQQAQRDDCLAVAQNSPLFQAASEAALRELGGMAMCRTYPKNNILFYQGDSPRDVYLVLSGAVKIALMNEDAREVALSHIDVGGLVGLISILDDEPHPANAVTLSPCRLARFDGQRLLAWFQRQPDTHPALFRELAQVARQAYQRIGEHAMLSVRERLLYTLCEIADREGRVFTRPTHQELANRIGCSREMVSRVLKELLDEDLLEAEGNVIRVTESALVLREE